jgi:hypothetical protein
MYVVCVISENEKCQSYVSNDDGIHHTGDKILYVDYIEALKRRVISYKS